MGKPMTWAEMVADPCAGQARILANQIEAKNEQIRRMRQTLVLAKEKLAIYRARHSGEYVGGIEYTALMVKIDEALNV